MLLFALRGLRGIREEFDMADINGDGLTPEEAFALFVMKLEQSGEFKGTSGAHTRVHTHTPLQTQWNCVLFSVLCYV